MRLAVLFVASTSSAQMASVQAHVAAWGTGMFCRNGSDPTTDDQNTNLAVNPLYDLNQEDWWFQHERGCDQSPPLPGDVLELPAGGSFEVEFGINRAFTTLSYDGKNANNWADGGDHPDNWTGNDPPECMGPLHAETRENAAGTAFAISYHSEIKDVTMENLVVFTTMAHSPWERRGVYQVPAQMAACPEGGCICAWLWVPRGCGQPNLYMAGWKCKVTGATSTAPLAAAQPPVYCEDDASKCVKGAKQMIAWNQKTGNNVEVPSGKSPGYNAVCGWTDGAQDDIFEEVGSEGTPDDSEGPTEEPSEEPTEELTKEPTEKPTEKSTEEPTKEPTEESMEEPTAEPMQTPAPAPTACKVASSHRRN